MSPINKHIVFGLVAVLVVASVASANTLAPEAYPAVTNSSGSIIGSIGRLGSKVVNTITGVGSSVISRGVGLFRPNPAQAAVQQEIYDQTGNFSQAAMDANNEVMDAVTSFGQEVAAQAGQPVAADAQHQQAAAAEGFENVQGAVQEPAPEVQGEQAAQPQQEFNQAGTEAAQEVAAQQPAVVQQQSRNKTETIQN